MSDDNAGLIAIVLIVVFVISIFVARACGHSNAIEEAIDKKELCTRITDQLQKCWDLTERKEPSK